MKILKIELKNLNSLRGQWTINLSDKIYEVDGIFAITGPTGAGKTTIFDAICLALYGQTPRLGTISGDKNEIMSRRTQECYASVIFESEGTKYLICWKQHRAGKNNKLQTASHVLSYADTGEIISSTVKETRKNIEEITGLDFKRFRQAVMLEQGGFDAFLKAGKNERAEILELLTGTEIYSEISSLIYDRTAQERDKLSNIKFLRESKKPSDDFQNTDEILDALSIADKNFTGAIAERDEIKKNLDWRRSIQRLESEYAEVLNDLERLSKRFEIFTADSKKLEIGQLAAELVGDFSSLTARRDNHTKLLYRVEKLQCEIDMESYMLSEIDEQKLPEAVRQLQKMIRNLSPEESPEIFYSRIKERGKIFDGLAKQKFAIDKEKERVKLAFNRIQAELKMAESYQASCQEIYDEAVKKFEEITNMRAEAIFELERRRLKPGSPCPICGATEHPRSVNAHEKNLDNVQNFDDALRIARDKTAMARKKLDEANRKLQLARAHEIAVRTKLDNLLQSFDKISEQHRDARSELVELMNVIGIKVAHVKDLIPEIDKWLATVKDLENESLRLTRQREFLILKSSNDKESLAQEILEREKSQSELKSLEESFADKLKEKNFDSEEDFKASILDANEIKRLTRLKQELESDKNRLNGIKDNIEAKLAAEKSKSLTQKSFDELSQEFKENESLINKLNREIIMLKNNLDQRKKLLNELAKLDKEYKRQEKIYADWDSLNKLIGSAKGDKFRVFAQSITLSMMIDLANIQLEKMNGRYILMARPDSDGLDLSVIDKEQAGEIRPTENLSGGERFIISLALALGLSQISGNKSRIDSLFLDEGFGSLDEDSLNMALDALGEVRRGGRMVGIISHVQALQERIAAQIKVIPQHEGVSIIEGPGVS